MGPSYRPVRIFPFGQFVCMDFFFIFLYCGSNKVVKLKVVLLAILCHCGIKSAFIQLNIFNGSAQNVLQRQCTVLEYFLYNI
jgi:hypothetical protein